VRQSGAISGPQAPSRNPTFSGRSQERLHPLRTPRREVLLDGPWTRYLAVMIENERHPMAFPDAQSLGDWLAEHHDDSRELWVRIYKAGWGMPSVTWNDCVVEAIRFGWIDGLKLPCDETSYLQRLTPRKAKSNWSVKNREHATQLLAEGRMAPAGKKHVDAAMADGRWETAYAGSAKMTVPKDFLDALETMPTAKAFFATLDRKNVFPIYYRLQTAKRPETRARRLAQILAQLERGERFH
jgi:uncharacterized protein YdeI (YjbR/CyaY-like superfamily)